MAQNDTTTSHPEAKPKDLNTDSSPAAQNDGMGDSSPAAQNDTTTSHPEAKPKDLNTDSSPVVQNDGMGDSSSVAQNDGREDSSLTSFAQNDIFSEGSISFSFYFSFIIFKISIGLKL